MEGLRKILSDDSDIVERINNLTKEIKFKNPKKFETVFGGINSGKITPNTEIMLNVDPRTYFMDADDKVVDLMPSSQVDEKRAEQISKLLGEIDKMAVEDADRRC